MDLSQFLGQKLKDAIQHHQIIYLKDHNTTLIRIVDLPKLWLNNQDLYYLINNYVVGNVETLITFKSLEAELDSAITGYNYEQSEVFNNKLKAGKSGSEGVLFSGRRANFCLQQRKNFTHKIKRLLLKCSLQL